MVATAGDCGYDTGPSVARRTFLRRSIGLGVVTATGGLAGCARGGEAIGDVADDADGGSPASPSDADIGLAAGMRIGLGPTALVGLAGPAEIDPDQPGGGRLLTVEAHDPDEAVTVSWRRTVERERTPETPYDPGVGESTPTPAVEVVEETGTVTASGLDDAHAGYLPMYWPEGAVETTTSAIWLSREAFDELRSTRQTRWSRDVLTRISRLSEEAVDRIHEGVDEVDEVYLNAEEEFVDVEALVDGERTTLSAIEAYDTFGNAYRILDDPRNPLIAKFTYDAVSTGFAGIDAGLWTLIKTVFSGYQVATIETP